MLSTILAVARLSASPLDVIPVSVSVNINTLLLILVLFPAISTVALSVLLLIVLSSPVMLKSSFMIQPVIVALLALSTTVPFVSVIVCPAVHS